MKRMFLVFLLLGIGLAFLLPATAVAGEGEAPGEEPEAPPDEGPKPKERNREGNRRDRGQERALKKFAEELGLDEEKAGKLREAMKEHQKAMREAVKEASKARDERLKELLTEDQLKKFREMERRTRRGGQPGRPDARSGRRPGGQGEARWPGQGNPGDIIRALVRELNLTEEQRPKVMEIVKEVQGEVQALALRAREEGKFEEVREKLKNMAAEVLERVKPVLTPEQLAKLEEMKKKLARRILRDPREGDRGGRREGGERNPEEAMKRKLQKIREDLDVIPEVWAVLGEKIEGILKHQMEFRRKVREQSKAVQELIEGEQSGEVVAKEIATLRELRKAHDEKLKTMREDLRELLDLKEEAKLILQGILD